MWEGITNENAAASIRGICEISDQPKIQIQLDKAYVCYHVETKINVATTS